MFHKYWWWSWCYGISGCCGVCFFKVVDKQLLLTVSEQVCPWHVRELLKVLKFVRPDTTLVGQNNSAGHCMQPTSCSIKNFSSGQCVFPLLSDNWLLPFHIVGKEVADRGIDKNKEVMEFSRKDKKWEVTEAFCGRALGLTILVEAFPPWVSPMGPCNSTAPSKVEQWCPTKIVSSLSYLSGIWWHQNYWSISLFL